MSRPWMPLYVGDYLADTRHLTTAEHGAYMLLIFHYWRTEGLPKNEEQLRRIAGLNEAEWATSRDTLAAFFDPDWKHKRIEFELTEAVRVSAAGRTGGIASGEARRKRTTVERPLNDQGNDSRTKREALQSQSQSQEKKDTGARAPKREKRGKTELSDDFNRDLEAPTKAGLTRSEGAREWEKFKNHARQNARLCVDWQSAWRNWCIKAAEFLGRAPPAESRALIVVSGFYATFDSPQLEAWNAYERAAGRSSPRDKTGGWRFPTEWPPGHEQAA